MQKAFLLLVLAFLFIPQSVVADDTRRFLLIVDYIGSDYTVAVQGGKVINAGEYQEMESFSADALSLFASLPPAGNPAAYKQIQGKLEELRGLVQRKADPALVAGLTKEIRRAAVDLYQVTTFPLQTPSLKTGKRLYKENCAECHAVDGSARTARAKQLNPPPTNFRDPSVMENLSAF
ncbi:MAG: c-type cytochrome, partial [Deltaproteobacteria bacterium]|nr:c-type cytochrome [Deltaproteobacteria bacterium]